MLAKREGIAIEVRSAGVSAMEGAAYSRHSADILRDKGAEGSGKSRFLHKGEIQWADLILTMTISHKRTVVARHPEAVDKIYALKEFAEDDPLALQAIQDGEALMSEVQWKQALGQPVTSAERDQLSRLSRLAPDYDIDDPFGGSRTDYEQVAAEIERAVAKLLQKLKSSD
jgi:protein-tyrosine phosphatase